VLIASACRAAEDRVPRQVGAENLEIRIRLAEPSLGLAVRNREALHTSQEDVAHALAHILRIRAWIGEPEDATAAGHRFEDECGTTNVLQSTGGEIKQEETATRAFVAGITQPDALRRESDDDVSRGVVSPPQLVELVVATGHIDHMESLSTQRPGDLAFRVGIAGSIGRDRIRVYRKPLRERTV